MIRCTVHNAQINAKGSIGFIGCGLWCIDGDRQTPDHKSGKWFSNKPETHYLLERHYQPGDLAPYEYDLLAILFPNPQLNTIAMTSLSRVYTSRAQGFTELLKQDMLERGFFQPGGSAALFGQYLPYATSFGLLRNWITCFQKQGLIEAPSWFQALAIAPHANHTTFTHMMIYTSTINQSSSSGGSSGGGGGAAGGGASGAG